MDVSQDTGPLPQEKPLEGFSHLRLEVREEISRFRERFGKRAIGLTSRISAGLPTATPVDFSGGRSVLRGVLEEVAEKGQGCALEIGLDAEKPFPGEGETYDLSLKLSGDGERLSEIERGVAARLRKEGNVPPDFSTFRGEGLRGWRIGFRSEAFEKELPHDEFHAGEVEEGFAQEYPHSVLVVDDSSVGRRLTVQILRNLGYDPAQAHNGREAVRLSRERDFTLVFMDLRMPDMDGVETMREIFRIRADKPRPAVVALTAEISDVERNHCIDAGMSDFLTKPCRPVELSHAIRTLSQQPLKAVPCALLKPLLPWRDAPVADEATLRTLWEMPGGKLSTLLEDLYDALRREMPDALRLVETAAKEGNVTSLRHEIHQLTGNFDVMGARRLALLCRTTGDAVKGGRPDEAKALIAEIPAHFGSFCAAVEAFMARARG